MHRRCPDQRCDRRTQIPFERDNNRSADPDPIGQLRLAQPPRPPPIGQSPRRLHTVRRPAPVQIQHHHDRDQRLNTTLAPLKRPKRRQADPG